MDTYWERALNGEGRAKEWLMKEYLIFLRSQEEQMRNGLILSLIRDSKLAQWKTVFTNRIGLKAFKHEVSCDAAAFVSGYRKARIERRKKRDEINTRRIKDLEEKIKRNLTPGEEMVLRRLEDQFPHTPDTKVFERYVRMRKQEELQTAWADFVLFIQNDFSNFMMDPENAKLQPDEIQALYEKHVDELIELADKDEEL